MKDVIWTEEELRQFDRLVDDVSSRDQLKRITGRIDMMAFIKEHGKEKCDAMCAYLENGEASNGG